jgi:hypothetical protein
MNAIESREIRPIEPGSAEARTIRLARAAWGFLLTRLLFPDLEISAPDLTHNQAAQESVRSDLHLFCRLVQVGSEMGTMKPQNYWYQPSKARTVVITAKNVGYITEPEANYLLESIPPVPLHPTRQAVININ